MRLESLEWTETMRDAHLWLTDDGRLVTAWGWVGDASHLCALRELEVLLDRRGATILITNGDADDAEMRELWCERNVDLVIVEEFAGLFGPCLLGVRREWLSGMLVEPTPQTWWVTAKDSSVTDVAVDWHAAVGAMLGIA